MTYLTTAAKLFKYTITPLGGVTILIGFGMGVRQRKPIKPWVAMLVGGTGGFGPLFFADYADFITKVAQLEPSSEEAKEAFEQVATDLESGEVPDDAKALAESDLKQTDVPNAEAVIDQAMERATPDGKESLSGVQRALIRRAEGAAIDASPARAPRQSRSTGFNPTRCACSGRGPTRICANSALIQRHCGRPQVEPNGGLFSSDRALSMALRHAA